MTTDTAPQTKNRIANTIPVAVCELCFVSVPEQQISQHLEWHQEQLKAAAK